MMVMIPDRLPHETDEEYDMFLAYLGDGVPSLNRSMELIARQFGCSADVATQISRQNMWVSRAAGYDVQYLKSKATDKRRARVAEAQNDPQGNLEDAIALSCLSKAGNQLNSVDDEESLSAAIRLLACYQALKQKG